MNEPRDTAGLPPWAARALAILFGSTVALLIATGVLAWRLATRPAPATLDADDRREAVRQMAASNSGLFDSHPDADVARVLTAELANFEHLGVRVDTNRFGLRERDYAVPKPAGTVRIALLGDSMVFGFRAAAEDRLGVFLERHLKTRSGADGAPDVEVLHLGVPSWNARTQAAFLRRQLSLIEPDLVLHILVPNDIEDDFGVRGFGAAATFSPQHRRRADGRVHSAAPTDLMATANPSLLRLGLDFESTSRYADLRSELTFLIRQLDRADIPYCPVFHYRRLGAVAWDEVGRTLEAQVGVETLYTSIDFGTDPAYAVATDDPHWNRRGHEMMALALYDVLEKARLLPQLDLAAWPEAAAARDAILTAGRRDATRPGKADRMRGRQGARVRDAIDFTRLDAQAASQVHGGVDLNADGDAELAPYASFLLRGGGSTLRLTADSLGRPELDGTRISISVDGEPVGDIELDGPGAIDVSFPSPAAVDRAFVTVRLESSDFVHTGDDLRRCRVLKLRKIAFER